MRVLAALVTFISLPLGGLYFSVQPAGKELLVSGFATTGTRCAWVTVDPSSLAAKQTKRTCDRPPASAYPYVPTVIPNRHSLWQNVRLAHVTKSLSYGPVVLRYQDSSDTRPLWTYGNGSLWLYDVDTTRGSIAMRFSATSGRVLETVPMPKLFRPVIAANDDGLWLVAAVNGGVSGQYPAALYHVAPHSRKAVIVHRGGRAALWITAHNHTVWAELISGKQSVALWRFDGTAATARPLSHGNAVGATEAVYGAGSLWGLAESGSRCTKERVLRIDAATGRETQIASVPILATCGSLILAPSALAFFRGALFFLDGQRLYRIRP